MFSAGVLRSNLRDRLREGQFVSKEGACIGVTWDVVLFVDDSNEDHVRFKVERVIGRL